MPWYLRPLDWKCRNFERCHRAATEELCNAVNASSGRYCGPCGRQALETMNGKAAE